MEVSTHCNGNVKIIQGFFTKEEAAELSSWFDTFPFEDLEVSSVKFWGKKQFHHSLQHDPKWAPIFAPVKHITDTIDERIRQALDLVQPGQTWHAWPTAFIKMYPGSNPNDYDADKMEMFYHMDNQAHMATLITWGGVMYLNEDYEGGEIRYPVYDFEYKPVAGSMVLHSGFTVHGVKKVTKGNRYGLTSLISRDGHWNNGCLPTPTGKPEGPSYIYPMGYWGRRVGDDRVDPGADIKILRPDGTTRPYCDNPSVGIDLWNKKYMRTYS
jgi:hypothetical protein